MDEAVEQQVDAATAEQAIHGTERTEAADVAEVTEVYDADSGWQLVLAYADPQAEAWGGVPWRTAEL
jgi:hypothetical protein